MYESDGSIYSFSFTDEIERKLKKTKKKDSVLYKRVQDKILGILNNPLSAKPLRNVLKNRWRIHIGQFVLVYEIKQQEVRFLDFDHHDKIYRK